MKVAVNSINNYLYKKLTTDEMVAGLERTEVEVEQIISSNDFDKRIIVGKTIAISKHPNADRLKIVSVDIGDNYIVKIICGAPNVATGQSVVLAQAGAILPDGSEIKKTNIRGFESNGMLCSANELNISDNHEGILLLPDGIKAGAILCDIWHKSDQLDIKTQPNRWDQLSLIGLAREASGYVGDSHQGVQLPENPPIIYETIEKVNVKKTGECKRFMTVKLSVKNNFDSPQWLVDNLEDNGLRSISPVVDLTNFVMLETGQPSHAYDFKKITGQLAVRRSSPTEKITTLDGVVRQLNSDDLVITDEDGPIGIAGVIGGQKSEVDQATTEIILEMANFDRTIVRKSALRHGLRTEASARFERSLPLRLSEFALPRLVELLKNVCQAKVIEGPFDQLYDWPWTTHIGLRIRRAEQVLGIKIDEGQVVKSLIKLGFEAEHFSLTTELNKHLGKPYLWGANYKQNGTDSFDCSYLTSYIYSLIGKRIGETAYEQFVAGEQVDESSLKPGDLVFLSGHWSDKKAQKLRHDVGHVGVYMGKNKIIHATQYEYKSGQWKKIAQPAVIESALSDFTNNPGYKGARRYVENFNHIIAVTVPWWRPDVVIEEDMIEEVIKIIGYEKLPTTTPLLPPMQTAQHQLLPRIIELKKFLVARGMFEVMTYSFISVKSINKVLQDIEKHLEILNPLSSEQQYLRSTLLPSLLNVVANNQHYQSNYELFEVSRVYAKHSAGAMPDENWQLGMVAYGPNSLVRLKGQIEGLAKINQLDLKIKAIQPRQFIEGRAGQINLAGMLVGQFGQISPKILNELKIDSEVSYAEINVELILDHKITAHIKDLLPYSPITREIAIEVDDNIYWQDILKLIIKNKFIIKVDFLNDFTDSTLKSAGRKSVAFRVTMDAGAQPKSEEIDSKTNLIIQNLKKNQSLNNLNLR